MGSDFLQWIGDNYEAEKKNLLRFNNCPDKVSEAILRVYEKLRGRENAPFNFRGYLFIAFRNLVYQKKKKLPALPADHTNTDDEAKELRQRQKREELTVNIQKWVFETFPPVEAGLFKFYYESGKTFTECAEITGFSKSFIHLKVSQVREAVRNQFKGAL